MTEDEDFIPYLVLVCFDRGTDLRDRIEESLPLLLEALTSLEVVYEGSSDLICGSGLLAREP